jgi:hypothetical protein
MTVKELLERLETIKDSLSDVDNRYGIEGTMDDLAVLIDDVDSFGVDDDITPKIDLEVSAEHSIRKLDNETN